MAARWRDSIDDGYVAGVVDVTTTEWCDEVVGGVLSAGPDRLGAAARAGIPQVVSVGALDMVNFGPIETVPERFRSRRLYRHNAAVTLMRTTRGRVHHNRPSGIAGQLNRATGPTVRRAAPARRQRARRRRQAFHDPDADRALFETLRAHLVSAIRIVEVDAHINDPAFAETVAQ